jgi:dolichyl-phosphate beta-glucosyltransferase
MSSPVPQLSVVVPAYNEERRIGQSLARIGDFLTGLPYGTEVLVVDDGSAGPGRDAVVAALAALPAGVARKLIRHQQNHGKGAAVRSGCLAAGGLYVAFLDADLATPPEELTQVVSALEAGANVAIGNRNHEGGTDMRDRRGIGRRLAGRTYSMVVRWLLLPDIVDSQCPLKAFQKDAARQLFSLQRIDTWAFDAELLYLARRLHLRVDKVPVVWLAMEGSHLRLSARAATRELWNLLRIRWLHRSVQPVALPAVLESETSNLEETASTPPH